MNLHSRSRKIEISLNTAWTETDLLSLRAAFSAGDVVVGFGRHTAPDMAMVVCLWNAPHGRELQSHCAVDLLEWKSMIPEDRQTVGKLRLEQMRFDAEQLYESQSATA